MLEATNFEVCIVQELLIAGPGHPLVGLSPPDRVHYFAIAEKDSYHFNEVHKVVSIDRCPAELFILAGLNPLPPFPF